MLSDDAHFIRCGRRDQRLELTVRVDKRAPRALEARGNVSLPVASANEGKARQGCPGVNDTPRIVHVGPDHVVTDPMRMVQLQLLEGIDELGAR
jgi:hypothetical protein